MTEPASDRPQLVRIAAHIAHVVRHLRQRLRRPRRGTLFSGTGAPTLSGIAGDFYFRKDGSDGARLYVNPTGGVNWTVVF